MLFVALLRVIGAITRWFFSVNAPFVYGIKIFFIFCVFMKYKSPPNNKKKITNNDIKIVLSGDSGQDSA